MDLLLLVLNLSAVCISLTLGDLAGGLGDPSLSFECDAVLSDLPFRFLDFVAEESALLVFRDDNFLSPVSPL